MTLTPRRDKPADDVEQPFDLRRGQHRRRLVQDQDTDLAGHRLGDLDRLLEGERKGADHGARVDGEAEILQQGRRPRAQRPARSPGAGSSPRKMFSATVKSGAKASSW